MKVGDASLPSFALCRDFSEVAHLLEDVEEEVSLLHMLTV